jgi:leucyl-tRNA synthetase
VSFADWPVVDQKQKDCRIELAEELLLRTVEDLESITKLIQITPKSITISLAPAWKHKIFTTIARAPDRNLAIRTIMKDDRMRRRGREATDATKQCTNLIHRLPPHTVELIASEGVNERAVFEQAAPFLEKEFGVPVHIVDAEGSPHAKAATALPFKPAIVIE